MTYVLAAVTPATRPRTSRAPISSHRRRASPTPRSRWRARFRTSTPVSRRRLWFHSWSRSSSAQPSPAWSFAGLWPLADDIGQDVVVPHETADLGVYEVERARG